jgi:hypothetical protein
MRNVYSLSKLFFAFCIVTLPFPASCPICGKELLPNKVASHIRHETNSPKGNMSTDQQESDHRATVHFNLIY